jgi:hypothetical protein
MELSPRVLQIPGETRFGATVLCLDRFVDKETHNALESMFTHPQFTSWGKKQPKTARIKIALAKQIVFDRKVRSKSKLLVKLLTPIMQVLRLFDWGVPVIGFVYFAVADLRARASKLMSDHQLSSSVKRSVLNIIDDLWEMFASDMHAAAYLLNPRYYHLIHDLVGDKELMHGLRRIIIKLTTSAEADILTRYRSSPKHTRLMHLNS